MKERPVHNGRVLPVEASDFKEKSALFLPKEVKYIYLVNLLSDNKSQNLISRDDHTMNSLGEV